MSRIWQFSSYSTPLVQKLLETVVTLENNNEWSEKFGGVTKHHLQQYKVHKLLKEHDEEPGEGPTSAEDGHPESVTISESLEKNAHDELFCNTIETEPSKIDYIIEECLERPYLITDLAEHLTMSSIEKVLNALFAKQNINEEFISLFLQTFFPVFLQREQTWLTLDLLLKASKIYPEPFELVLMSLIKNVKIKCSILQELTQSMGEQFQKHLMFLITHTDISPDVFIHHLHTLNLVYKDCEKTEYLQNFIQLKLIENAPLCINDKNYGRLFLTFLQAQKGTGFFTNLSKLDICISQHNSPFKRPCLNILKEIAENNQT